MLRETEELFWRLISAPEGVAETLRHPDNKSVQLDRVLRGDERLSAVQRLDIYANMYFFRLLDILRADYEAVVACVGGDHFHNLVTDYLQACPSQHPSVRNVGERLPRFLDGHALGLERPWLGDLARLERARLELHDGPDAEVLTLDELRGLAPEDFVTLQLPLIPSLTRLPVGWAVADVWRAAEAHDADAVEPFVPEPPAAGAHQLLVWRQELMVYHRPLEPLEAEALAQLADGASFGRVCDLVSAHMPVEEAGPFAFQWLAQWLQDGLIARAE